MKRLLFVLLLVCITAFAGCTTYQTKAILQEKHYRAAYSYIQMIPVSNGKDTTLIPTTRYMPASWTLSVCWTYNGKQATHILEVDETTYHQMNIGDEVSLTVCPGWWVEMTEQ